MSGGVLWLLMGLPALAGTILCLGGRRLDKAAVPVSLTVAAVVAVLAFAAASGTPSIVVPFIQEAGFGLSVDGLSAVVLPAVTTVTLLVLIFASATEIAPESSPPARFHGLMLLFTASVIVTVTATTLVTLLFAWELMGAASYALIGFHWQEQRRVSGGLTAFLVTRTADLGLYVSAAAALAGGAGLDIVRLADADAGWRHVIAGGILVAALGKAAQLPFSFWLSRAMAGPSPVSALLHSAAMVAMGGYLLLRTTPLLEATGWAGPTAAWSGAVTAVVLGAVAVAQKDLKQLLAASTAAQLGFVVMGAGLGAVAGGATHLVAHAATKALLFLAAGAWLAALGTKQLAALRGAGRRWPLVGMAFAVGTLSLAGVAPLSLWATKDAVLAVALEHSPALYVAGMAGALLSAAYAGKAFVVILWRQALPSAEGGYDTEETGTRRVGLWETVPLLALAGPAAVLGVLALPPVNGWLSDVLGTQEVPGSGWVELAVSAVLAALVVVLVTRFDFPAPGWATKWLGLERAAHLVVVRPCLGLAHRLARFDDHVIDHAVGALPRATGTAARRVSRFDDAGIDGAVDRVARTGQHVATGTAHADTVAVDAAVERVGGLARRIGVLARRPQTGQVHHYYAQAAVIVSAAIVLLILAR